MTPELIIGIDPDVDKSGVATLHRSGHTLRLESLTFAEVVERLSIIRATATEDILAAVLVVIEAGWLNRAHWHLSPHDTRQSAAAKGNAAGRNHQVGRLLAEMCEYYKIPYRLQRPLRKCWKGKDGKITHEEIAAFAPISVGRTNQEERDAALLAWNAAGLPIRITPRTKQNKL